MAIAAAMSLASSAQAADQVEYAPPESWVTPLAIPTIDPALDSGAVQILLQDDQTHFGSDADVFYSERAVRIRTPQGLGNGNFIASWKPDTETLTIHKLHIIRDRQVIDVLTGSKKLTVLRRETNLEAAALDGALTATIQPEDLRVGDIIDYAISLRRKDPLRRGFSEGFGSLEHPGIAGRIHLRAIWASSKPIRWRATDGMDTPVITTKDGETEAVVDRQKAVAPKKPLGAPPRFLQIGQLEFTQFRNWAEVSSLMAPLYQKAAALGPNSPIKAEAAKIKGEFSDPKQRAFAALKLVEEKTRYVFLGMNLGGYLPADADETWIRRFGDCKGKTVLLLALLHELGIQAEAAFVNSSAGDGIDQRLPMLALFDHVLVRAEIGGKTYWMDGTRLGDRNLDDMPPPAFHWALPVRTSGAQLLPIAQEPFAVPQSEKIARLELKGGVENPATVHLEHLFRGDAGIYSHLAMDGVSKADLDQRLRQYWSSQYPWTKATAVGTAYDAQAGVMRIWMDGTGILNWTASGPYRDFMVIDSSIGGDPNYHREEGPNKDAPFVVDFPAFERRSVTVVLPQHGAGFTLWNPNDLNTVVAGVSYKRTARMQDGVVTVQTEERSLAPDFPAADAEKASAVLRKMDFDNVFVRALAPSSPPAAAAAASDPVDAPGFAADGARALGGGDYDRALKSFSRAIALNPASGKYVYDRGAAYFQKGEDALALADFDQALKLNPADSLALMARAELQLLHGDESQARRDFDHALKAAPNNRTYLRRRADAYRDSGRWSQAIGYYETWLKLFPADSLAIEVRAQLCLARAESGATPAGVLAECEAVTLAKPELAAARAGQALALLRLGRNAEAIASFNAVPKDDPSAALAAYGRGVALIRSGAKSQGEADLAAASALDSGVARSFKGYGLAP